MAHPLDFSGRPCPDCGVSKGQLHEPGCDVERCPSCGGQMLSCECSEDEVAQWSHRRQPWLEDWPGCAECRELGFWCCWSDTKGWIPCSEDTPGAGEDLNRLMLTCQWDREQQRWVLPGQEARAS